jgi:hypothetical protein
MILAPAVAMLAAITGFTHWTGDGFPARSEPLAGTPVELRIQDGVTARELHAIRGGLRLVDRFARRSLRRSVRGPVEARVAHADLCRGSDSRDRDLIGEGGAGFLCVDTANVQWRVLIHSDRAAALAVSGHEYVHVLQSELGCLPSGGEQRYHWIVEGMATHIAWRALVAGGQAGDAHVRTAIRRDGAFDPQSEPLRHYERGGGRTAQYSRWHAAIRSLMRTAVATGAAPAAVPEVSLRVFCERVGAGVAWRTAFARSFGLSLEEFYARFEGATP